MIRTFRISFSLKNTYRVNTILYSLKQIPLIRKILPQSLYRSQGLKIFANILSGLWEIAGTFLGKVLYLLIMVFGLGMLYENTGDGRMFVHILFFLSLVGSYMNTYMFNPSNDKYYAMILMRMDARSYTLTNYAYAVGKCILGFLPFTIWFGVERNIPLWCCLLFPFFIASVKMLIAWNYLVDFKRTGESRDENLPGKLGWILTAVLLAAAYGLPYLGVLLPMWLMAAFMVLSVAAACGAAVYMGRFDEYRTLYQQLLAKFRNGMDYKATVKAAVEEQNRKLISQDTGITSSRKGFEYFNELFVRRHQKILWKSVKRQAVICLFLFVGILFLFQVNEDIRKQINRMLMVFLPYFVFIMYMINRGTSFTQALFMNCDHSMLTYSFYKKPEFILKLFRIRLREIVKVNLLPASVIGVGLPVLLYFSGGTDNPVNYLLLFVSVMAMSAFFSVHYLTCYYLLQPYNAGTEVVGGTYKIVTWATYIVCLLFMNLRMSTLVFGTVVTCFCLIYCVVACIVVYRVAGRTFRIRN